MEIKTSCQIENNCSSEHDCNICLTKDKKWVAVDDIKELVTSLVPKFCPNMVEAMRKDPNCIWSSHNASLVINIRDYFEKELHL